MEKHIKSEIGRQLALGLSGDVDCFRELVERNNWEVVRHEAEEITVKSYIGITKSNNVDEILNQSRDIYDGIEYRNEDSELLVVLDEIIRIGNIIVGCDDEEILIGFKENF